MSESRGRTAKAAVRPFWHGHGISRRRVVSIVALLVAAVLAVFAYQVVRTSLALRDARDQAKQLRSQLDNDDAAGAERSAEALARQGRVARGNSDNVLWRMAAHVPFAGDDVHAVSVLARVLDDLSGSYPVALEVHAAITDRQLRSADGRIDVRRIGALAPSLDSLAAAAKRADDTLAPVDAEHLIPPLRRATAAVQKDLAAGRAIAGGGATAARLITPMLGADGERKYLLVVQNNAEIRATGGIPGALSLLVARDGKVRMGAQRSATDFQVLGSPVLPLTQDERALYGNNLGVDLRDTNVTPDFPRTAELLSAMLARRFGDRVDGVVSVDPVTLASLLRATGPIRVGTETFTSENVLSMLLSDVYERFPRLDVQDAYFAAAARGIFDALLTGDLDQGAALGTLFDATNQRRLLIWSSHAEEQQRLDGTAIAGGLPRDRAKNPQVGLYLNDSTAAKVEYYLDYTGGLKSVRCTSDGVQTLQAHMTLRSSVPRDPRQLSRYVTGIGGYAPKGWMRMNLRIYAPAGGKILGIRANESDVPIQAAEHDGRPVAVVGLMIKPQQEVRVSVSLTSRPGQTGDSTLQWTPGMRWEPDRVQASSTCD